jgi:hypothetical protein
MTKKNPFVLSAVFVLMCATVVYGQFVGQTSRGTMGNICSPALSTDGDPMPPFPVPPSMVMGAGQDLGVSDLTADGDPMPPFPIPPMARLAS